MTESLDTAEFGPLYENMISRSLRKLLLAEAEPVVAIPGLKVSRRLKQLDSDLDTLGAQQFICRLYERSAPQLKTLLEQRVTDRIILDGLSQSYVEANRTLDYLSTDYKTVINQRDTQGRLLVGRLPKAQQPQLDQVTIPDWLKGDQITLFGPPDTEKMSINAMNALHHRLPNEADIISELVEASNIVPRWGADSEDSKTPIMSTLMKANDNLEVSCRHFGDVF